MNGSLFLKNWYLNGSTFKFCGGTSLPKSNLSAPGLQFTKKDKIVTPCLFPNAEILPVSTAGWYLILEGWMEYESHSTAVWYLILEGWMEYESHSTVVWYLILEGRMEYESHSTAGWYLILEGWMEYESHSPAVWYLYFRRLNGIWVSLNCRVVPYSRRLNRIWVMSVQVQVQVYLFPSLYTKCKNSQVKYRPLYKWVIYEIHSIYKMWMPLKT